MNRLNDALIVLVPLFYFATVVAYWLQFDSERRFGKKAGIAWAVVTLFVHICHFGVRGAIVGHFPLTTVIDSLMVLGAFMLTAYVVAELATGIAATGFYLLSLPAALVTVACAVGPHDPKHDPRLDTPLFLLHAIPAVGGIAAVFFSGLYGTLYLRLAHEIRTKKFGRLFARLESLDLLARMNQGAAWTAFLLATAAIGYGAVRYAKLYDRVNVAEPKILVTLAIWFVLGIPVLGRATRKMSDRAASWWAVVIMSIVLLSIVYSFCPTLGFHANT